MLERISELREVEGSREEVLRQAPARRLQEAVIRPAALSPLEAAQAERERRSGREKRQWNSAVDFRRQKVSIQKPVRREL